jgi:hypothetical protein
MIDLDPEPVDRDHLDAVQADGVGPVRGPRAEHSGHGIARITAGDREEHAAVRPVEPGQHQDLGPGTQVAQGVGHAGLEDQPGRRRTLVGLHGRLGHLGQRRFHPANRHYLDRHPPSFQRRRQRLQDMNRRCPISRLRPHAYCYGPLTG